MASKKKKISLAPQEELRQFLFHACLVEQKGNKLTVTVPATELEWRGSQIDAKGHPGWTPRKPLSAKQIDITCEGERVSRFDSHDYPLGTRPKKSVKIVFTGGAAFGRVLPGKSSKLAVAAKVDKISGLPKGVSWDGYQAIELSGVSVKSTHAPAPAKSTLELADGEGRNGGPHQPYP